MLAVGRCRQRALRALLLAPPHGADYSGAVRRRARSGPDAGGQHEEERWQEEQDRALRTATGLRAAPDLAPGALLVLDPLIEALNTSAFGDHIDF